MNTDVNPMYGWNTIAWKKVERNVFKLQKRIYRAEQRGEVKTVRTLQKLLMKSRSTKLLAVRRVTQDNQGKKTAGVDGLKSIEPEQRLALTDTLRLTKKAMPVRRVLIPKPGKDEQRPLGIPIVRSHCTSYNRVRDFCFGKVGWSDLTTQPSFFQSTVD